MKKKTIARDLNRQSLHRAQEGLAELVELAVRLEVRQEQEERLVVLLAVLPEV
jgi:hypothetical protein